MHRGKEIKTQVNYCKSVNRNETIMLPKIIEHKREHIIIDIKYSILWSLQ